MIRHKPFTFLLLGVLILLTTPIYATDIESITVTASTTHTVTPDPTLDISILESLIPETTVAGKFGGFSGFNERGTQSTHTAVFRNGIPANDPGAGWYDFGHDLATGNESVKIINGPNSVLYGSGSLGGTVFINDDIKSGTTMRTGDKHGFVTSSYQDIINITYFDTSNGSVRTDNDEEDFYKNITARLNFDLNNDWTARVNYTDYAYDFDQCWNNWGIATNDCAQEGKKGTVSLRNDSTTFGYSFNDADYFALADKTWTSKATRYYADHRQHVWLFDTPVLFGTTIDREEYAGNHQTNVAIYGVVKYDSFELGSRVTQDASVFRIGYELSKFFANVGTSFSSPSLYQIYGDSWTLSNSNLKPEEALGYEVGYANLSFFKYTFAQGIDYDFVNNQYVNIGKYKTRGARYTDRVQLLENFWMRFDIGYTDSDQPRIPKYKFVVTSNYEFDNYIAKLTYTGLFNRKSSIYDTSEIEDITSFDLSIQRQFLKNVLLSFTARDILNREFEVVPGYGAGGRQLFLALHYTY